MKIAVYSLCRDRIEYTKQSFASLLSQAGHPFDHFVVDNGSQDGTGEWLSRYQPRWLFHAPCNVGISIASNIALNTIFRDKYDLIIKFDNDCQIESSNILRDIVELYQDSKAQKFVLSPKVLGLNNPPKRHSIIPIGRFSVGITTIVGGIFHVVPSHVYAGYRYPENLPLAKGQDDHFCHWFKTGLGGEVGYIESLSVRHIDGTDGQAKRFPSYFARKHTEERIVPGTNLGIQPLGNPRTASEDAL